MLDILVVVYGFRGHNVSCRELEAVKIAEGHLWDQKEGKHLGQRLELRGFKGRSVEDVVSGGGCVSGQRLEVRASRGERELMVCCDRMRSGVGKGERQRENRKNKRKEIKGKRKEKNIREGYHCYL